jgi:hypothetical protein
MSGPIDPKSRRSVAPGLTSRDLLADPDSALDNTPTVEPFDPKTIAYDEDGRPILGRGMCCVPRLSAECEKLW